MLPPIRVHQLDQKGLRATVAIAINTHLHGAVTIEELAAWALKFFHAMNQQVDEEDDDDDMDEANEPTVIDADLLTILDELMFADHPNLAPTPETMRRWAEQLMR
jgi:hypothetical protein